MTDEHPAPDDGDVTPSDGGPDAAARPGVVQRATATVVGGVRRYAPLYPFVLVGWLVRWLAVMSWFPSCSGLRPKNTMVEEQCLRAVNWGDAFYFFQQAKLLAEGHGYAQPKAWLFNAIDPSVPAVAPGAGHPPFYSTFLALLYKLGLTTPAEQRPVFAFVGALGVLLIGIAAWKIAGRHGRSVGMIAAAIAATYPILWINDFRYLSESVYIPMVAVFLILIYKFWGSPSLRNAAYVGAALGVMSLTRGEGFFILVCTMVPLLLFLRQVPLLERFKQLVVTGLVTVLFMVPWWGYNLSRFDEPVLSTSGTGIVLIHSACPDAYDGPLAGYYTFSCADLLGTLPREDRFKEDKADKFARRLAMDYLKANLSELPRVALLRVGRMWYVYAPLQDQQLDAKIEGRGDTPTLVGMWYYFALLPPTVLGAIVMWRRRIPISPIVGMAVAVSATAAATFGVTRYRVPADVGMVVMAAFGLDATWRWLWVRVRGRTEETEPGDGDGPGTGHDGPPPGPAADPAGPDDPDGPAGPDDPDQVPDDGRPAGTGVPVRA